MRFCFCLPTIALMLALQGALTFATAQTKPATAEVSGRVTIGGRGAAGLAVGLRVRMIGQQQPPYNKTTTDAEGNYRLKDISPGNYDVTVFAPVFVTKESSIRSSRTILVAEGEVIENIDFELIRGAVVTGKVTNAEGKPIIEERVSLFAVTPGTEARSAAKVGMTDDRGIYRIFGVRPGQYRVAAGQNDLSRLEASRARSIYQRTFHPDVTEAEKAKIIELSEGGEATGVDITLGSTVQTFAAAGRVVDEAGQPVTNIAVAVRHADPRLPGFSGQAVVSNTNGEFRITSLPPGQYTTIMMPRGETEIWAESVTFDILDQDVSGLLIKLHKGASITGTLVLENSEDRAARAKLSQLQINVFVQASQPNAGGRRMTIASDSSFRVTGLPPGNATIYLDSRNVPANKGFSIVRVEKDGLPQHSNLPVKAGEQLTAVRVVLAYGSGVINGTVRIDNGTLPPGARIFVRVHRLGERNPIQLFSTEVDSRGRFRIENVPLGTYDIYAYTQIPNLRGSAPQGHQQLLVSGQSTEVTIAVDLKQPQTPTN